jgi:hypothetical protein
VNLARTIDQALEKNAYRKPLVFSFVGGRPSKGRRTL